MKKIEKNRINQNKLEKRRKSYKNDLVDNMLIIKSEEKNRINQNKIEKNRKSEINAKK